MSNSVLAAQNKPSVETFYTVSVDAALLPLSIQTMAEDSCCCGACNITTGVVIVAFVELLFNVFFVIFGSVICAKGGEKKLIITAGVIVAVHGLVVLGCISAMVGGLTKNKMLIWPLAIMMIIKVIAQVILNICVIVFLVMTAICRGKGSWNSLLATTKKSTGSSSTTATLTACNDQKTFNAFMIFSSLLILAICIAQCFASWFISLLFGAIRYLRVSKPS